MAQPTRQSRQCLEFAQVDGYNHNRILRKHLESPQMKCVTFTSPQTQNELLEVVAKHILLKQIVQEVKEAKFYSVMADEVTSHNCEQLALCIRFVGADNTIREEFLQFSKLARITWKHVADEIIQILEDLGIPVVNMCGQGYDGAPNMSSHRVGAQAYIKQQAPLAAYIHCSGHCLNLVIVHSCSLPEVRNVLDKLKKCCFLFLNSPKREGLLQLVVSNGVTQETKRKVMLDLCRTCWAMRHVAYQHFYQSYMYLVEALEVIGYRKHPEKYPMDADWDTTSRSDAQQILASITSFDFVIVFMTIYQYLSHLHGITIQLQKTTLDIIEAHSLVRLCCMIFRPIQLMTFASTFLSSIMLCRSTRSKSCTRTYMRTLMTASSPSMSKLFKWQRRWKLKPVSHVQQRGSNTEAVSRVILHWITTE